jgi:hypothetical protein
MFPGLIHQLGANKLSRSAFTEHGKLSIALSKFKITFLCRCVFNRQNDRRVSGVAQR